MGQKPYEEFKKLFIQEYKDYSDLNPRVDSVHLKTEKGLKNNEFVLLKLKL